MDLYKVLGVDRNASKFEIKIAYRKLSKKLHPDVDGGDEEKFKEVSKAYDILSDDEKRARYDSTGSTSTEPSFDHKFLGFINEVVMPLFDKYGDMEFDFIKEINSSMKRIISNGEDTIKSLESQSESFEKRAKKFTKKGEGQNLISSVLLNRAGLLKTRIKIVQSEIDFMTLCRDAINEYEYDFDGGDSQRGPRFFIGNDEMPKIDIEEFINNMKNRHR